MSKRMRISAEPAVKKILNFVNQSDNGMDNVILIVRIWII